MPRRGGNWNNGSEAGAFALNLNNERSNSNSNIGFRSAVLPIRSVRRKALSSSMVENGFVSLLIESKKNKLLVNQLVVKGTKGDTISAILISSEG